MTLTVTGADKGNDNSLNRGTSDSHAPSGGPVYALAFQVKDTGIGIRQEDLVKLFQEFQRIEEERNRNIEGTGLGMSITTQLLELMGSKLEVDSVYGEGSTFSFTLEQKVIDAEPIGNLGERIKKRATKHTPSQFHLTVEAHQSECFPPPALNQPPHCQACPSGNHLFSFHM